MKKNISEPEERLTQDKIPLKCTGAAVALHNVESSRLKLKGFSLQGTQPERGRG